MIRLKTERLILRPVRLEDAPAMHQLFGTDEDMYRYSGWNPYATVEAARSFIRMTLEDDDPHAHSLVIEHSGKIVGNIGAYDYDAYRDSIEVGYSIEKASWGRGFATEALKAVLRFLTESEGTGAVTAWCAADNIGSRTAMERAGMVLESIEKDGLKIGDATYDRLNYVYRRPKHTESATDGSVYFTLRDKPELKDIAAEWFHGKWGVPKEAYLECMESYLNNETDLGWYLCMDGDRIVGGLGVIENDFHDRKDLSPNVCAVYTEEEYRCKGIAGHLLNMAVDDLRTKGISPVYLVTDHTGFYEKYGWEFLFMVHGNGEPDMTRMYIHR